jgi:hypothetical protein
VASNTSLRSVQNGLLIPDITGVRTSSLKLWNAPCDHRKIKNL